MTVERVLHVQDPSDQGPPQARGAHLSELRRRADQYAQVAREAIEQVKSRGDARRQLENLKNVGGQ